MKLFIVFSIIASMFVGVISNKTNAQTTLSLNTDNTFYSVGDTVTVRVDMDSSDTPVWGGQFFLSYNSSVMHLVSANVGDVPFTLEIYRDFSTIGNIDYAVGTSFSSLFGATNPTTMAVFVFQADARICSHSDLVSFRYHLPSTSLTDGDGNEVLTVKNNAGSISIDCVGDFNRSGKTTVQDLFDYLESYFAGTTSLGLFDYLDGFFSSFSTQ